MIAGQHGKAFWTKYSAELLTL